MIKQVKPEEIYSGIDLDKLFKFDQIILHHTADMVDSNHDGLFGAEVDRMQRSGQRAGYPPFNNGIGYHFLINPNGIIEVGDRWLKQIYGAHCVGHNSHALGICMVGNFDKGLPTEQQIYSLGELLVFLPPVEVFPHRAFKATDCPGTMIDKAYWNKNIEPLIRYEGNKA